MDDLQSKIRRNQEDKISTLPDELIHHILSFVDSSLAVKTSVLSKRWINLWSTLPFLNFNPDYFSDDESIDYDDFVDDFFTERNQQSPTSSIKISFENVNESVTRNILDYATTHHIEQFKITDAESNSSLSFPMLKNLSLKHCKINLMNWCLPCLQTLSICGYQAFYPYDMPLSFPLLQNLHISNCKPTLSTWSLPSLTTLHLESLSIGIGERQLRFERFNNLKKLTLEACLEFSDAEVLTINSPNLTSLALFQGDLDWQPTCTFMVTAPNLSSFEFEGECVPTLCAVDGFPLLNQVKLDVHIHIDKYNREEYNSKEKKKQVVEELITLFHELQTTKFLALSFMTIQVLSRLPIFLEYYTSPFGNLKSLTLQDSILEPEHLTNFPDHAISYLLSSSPCAKIFIKDRQGVTRNYDPKKNVLLWEIYGYPVIQSKVPAPSSTRIHLSDEVPYPETVKNKTNPPLNGQQDTSNVHVNGDGMLKVLGAIPHEVVHGALNDKTYSYREKSGYSLWEGHQIYSEYVDLLTRIKEKHPETFEQFAPETEIIYTVGLSTFCSVVQSFSEDYRSNFSAACLTRYRGIFSDLEKWGFNTTWLVNHLSNTDEDSFFCRPSLQ